MLLRILIVGEKALVQRIAGLVRHDNVILEKRERASLKYEPLPESFELVVAEEGSFNEPLDVVAQTLRKIPDAPEVIALQRQEDPLRRAALLTAGCLGVLSAQLPDEVLAGPLNTIINRRRELLVQRLGLSRLVDKNRLGDFASSSPAMAKMLVVAQRVAEADSSLLILGETGVGKEWFARAIHAEGPRARAPFIAVNCAAVPESLLESELFGHERGAFTGASKSRRGYFELAHKGTIFLDEITEMSPHLQAKLLRVLQERQVQRLGAEKPIDVDLRIMAATNRDPDEAIKAKTFRSDLYYRLSVVTLPIPPLRDRPEDIPSLARRYLEKFRVQMRRPPLELSDAALAALSRYSWPGNVRELINVMERAVLLTSSTVIYPEDLPESIAMAHGHAEALAEGAPPNGFKPIALDTIGNWQSLSFKELRKRVLLQLELQYLDAVLRDTRGSILRTAKLLGVAPRSIYNKMRQFKLNKEDYKQTV